MRSSRARLRCDSSPSHSPLGEGSDWGDGPQNAARRSLASGDRDRELRVVSSIWTIVVSAVATLFPFWNIPCSSLTELRPIEATAEYLPAPHFAESWDEENDQDQPSHVTTRVPAGSLFRYRRRLVCEPSERPQQLPVLCPVRKNYCDISIAVRAVIATSSRAVQENSFHGHISRNPCDKFAHSATGIRIDDCHR